MYSKKIALGLAAGLLLAAAAQAQVAVTADVGSTGVGAHLVVPMESNVNGRFGLNYARFNTQKTANSVDYDIKAKLQTFDVLFDWYLRDNSSFHLTGGVIYNGNQFDGKGKPNGSGKYVINGMTYNAADVGTLDGGVEYRKAAPYFGIGWGNALAVKQKWNFTGELGGFYQGKGTTKLVSLGCTTSNLVCKTLATDVAAERVKFDDQVNDLPRIYPVLRVALAYHF